jgi:hypothetical protein
MPQIAVAYSPTATGGTSGTVQTGSFYLGNMIAGKTWNQTVTATGGNTFFYASPLTASSYIMAIPKAGASPTQPQFFASLLNGALSKTDGAFISTCSYILRNYQANGTVGQPGANPAGCSSVPDCQTQFTATGWFQNYNWVAPV